MGCKFESKVQNVNDEYILTLVVYFKCYSGLKSNITVMRKTQMNDQNQLLANNMYTGFALI